MLLKLRKVKTRNLVHLLLSFCKESVTRIHLDFIAVVKAVFDYADKLVRQNTSFIHNVCVKDIRDTNLEQVLEKLFDLVFEVLHKLV